MNVGIIVYSQTGHTLEVCEKLKERLAGKGHTVSLERVTVKGERTPQTKTFELENQPDVAGYEGVVFASYVEAFSLCQVMARYLKNVGSLQGKHVACLATQQFPYPWMGGNHAIHQMVSVCRSKGATSCASAVVNWAQSKRESTIAKAIARLGIAF